jgi:3-oxoacyl-[acyl-carrier protein] reductase
MPELTFGDLSGLRAVVTGASTGIGRAMALELARGGADVVVHARASKSAAENVAEEIRKFGRSAHVLLADLSEREALPSFTEDCYQALGGCELWINNAGVDLLTGGAAKLEYLEKLERLLAVDVWATVALSKLIGERMREAGGGVILNIGWDQSDRGMGGDSGELFATAKNAIMGFTRSLAVSLAPEVRVNCIAPGWIRTAWGEGAGEYWQERVLEETPLKRWGTPEDIACAARFLASPQAAYITGQVININGGAVR